jgi:hypothetical protein
MFSHTRHFVFFFESSFEFGEKITQLLTGVAALTIKHVID